MYPGSALRMAYGMAFYDEGKFFGIFPLSAAA
jgi:hypothetical protein